jgi:4-hydroxyacetophenone monooxygenase
VPDHDGLEPITDDDATIRAALEHAEPGALLAALAYATGDQSLLREDLLPDPLLAYMPGAEPPAELIAQARDLAFEVLRDLRDNDSASPAAPPDDDALRAMLAYATGGAGAGADVERYQPLFLEELGIGGDQRAPRWHVPDGVTMRVAVIGAGMSGLLAAYRLRQAGIDVTVLEKNRDVGGTWLENSYPGCRVDVPNHFYSYSFAQRLDWPQHFSSQDVLLDYFRRCADEFGVREVIRFGTEVTAMTWSDDTGTWSLELSAPDGDDAVEVDAVVSAVGQLNRPSTPDIAGLDTFAGPAFHSARWDHSVDVAGKRVAVIGTGASAMQLIPAIAEQVGHLDVFQRTPAWLAPTPEYYQDVPDGVRWLFRHVPGYAHWYRFWLFWRWAEGMAVLVGVDDDWPDKTESVGPLNELLRQFMLAYLAEQFGDSPELLEQVTPHYPPGSKRMVRDDGSWARTLKRDDVELVTTGIAEVTPTGVRTVDGVEHPADVLVYGTGFMASDFLMPMKVVGRDGVELHDRWQGDAHAYNGVTVPGYPNLFLMYGPNTNIVVNGSIIFFSECETQYILEALRLLVEGGHRSLDVRTEVHDAYNAEVDAANLAKAWGVATVNSWYRNATGRSAQNWPFTLLEFWERTRHLDPADYHLR